MGRAAHPEQPVRLALGPLWNVGLKIVEEAAWGGEEGRSLFKGMGNSRQSRAAAYSRLLLTRLPARLPCSHPNASSAEGEHLQGFLFSGLDLPAILATPGRLTAGSRLGTPAAGALRGRGRGGDVGGGGALNVVVCSTHGASLPANSRGSACRCVGVRSYAWCPSQASGDGGRPRWK